MNEISGLIAGNEDLVYLSITLIVVLGLIKFFTNKILAILMLFIIGFNAYFFTSMTKLEKKEVIEQIKKMKDNKGEYVKKFDPFFILPSELKEKLKSHEINNMEDIVKYLDKTLDLNEYQLKKINKENALKAFETEKKKRSTLVNK